MLGHPGIHTSRERVQDRPLTILPMTAEKKIDAGIDRLDRRGFDRHPTHDRIHFKVIGHDQTFESEVATQDFLENGGTQRRGSFGIDRFEEDVCAHDRGDSGVHGGDEGTKFDSSKTFEIMREPRQFKMAVLAGVTMTGKMLRAGGDRSGLHRRDPDRSELGDEIESDLSGQRTRSALGVGTAVLGLGLLVWSVMFGG